MTDKSHRNDGLDLPTDMGGGLYIHVAYCQRKCIYCDFYSAGARTADWSRYTSALIAELDQRKDEMPCPLRTIYVGGGTPSLMPPDEFIRLAKSLKPYANDVVEFTLEANPDDVTDHMLNVWKSAGVNRLSIGIQSFDNSLLAKIGRRHDSNTAQKAYHLAREYFDNISIDLMFGLPGQTIELWRRDIDKAIDMKPEHISAYSLMYEPGTALTLLRDKGRLSEAPEETSEKMFRILIEKLKDAGYDHYEISNFALPGCRSLHNSSYWLQHPYLGLGPSAHSYDGMRCRSAVKTDITGYLDHWMPSCQNSPDGSNDNLIIRELLSDEELQEEYIMTRLRTREGIPLIDFTRQFGDDAHERLLKKSRSHIANGNLEIRDSHLALTESAILMSDSIILDLA